MSIDWSKGTLAHYQTGIDQRRIMKCNSCCARESKLQCNEAYEERKYMYNKCCETKTRKPTIRSLSFKHQILYFLTPIYAGLNLYLGRGLKIEGHKMSQLLELQVRHDIFNLRMRCL